MGDENMRQTSKMTLKDWIGYILQASVLVGGVWTAVNLIQTELAHHETELADHELRLRAVEALMVSGRAERVAWQEHVTAILMQIQHDVGELQGKREQTQGH